MKPHLFAPVLPSSPASQMKGVHTSLAELLRLRYETHGLVLSSRQPWRSLLHGRYASKIKGRGTDFAELRGYQLGDDIRAIDWRVTARTNKPYVRLYHEERERPVMLVLDQRLSMFFGSKRALKSVTAAEAAALAAWRVFADGDRVGALLFNDVDVQMIRPAGGQAHLLHVLGCIVERDHALQADGDRDDHPQMLNKALHKAVELARHGHLIVIISDFHGIDAQTRQLILGLRQRNDVVLGLIYDPLALNLPDDRQLWVGAAGKKLKVDLSVQTHRDRVQDFAWNRQTEIRAWEVELGVPVLPITTSLPVAPQLRALLGGRPSPVKSA